MSSDKTAILVRYAALIRENSERAGLTSRGDVAAIEQRHFAESLALLLALEERGLARDPVIDIGSGAGFPGLPIKIFRPELRMTLLEANAKKAAFLERVIAELALKGVDVVNERAEDTARLPDHRGIYALAMARTVAPLRVLLELALPLLQLGGVLAAPKGSAATREITEAEDALRELGGVVEETWPLGPPLAGPTPTVVLVRKRVDTPERYPRRAGIPRKRPL
ncbi:MAG: 16S rRNA (guanine(527)-N(7))-methyltransferase RsmG [Dehalococcoidia bacterium]